jgi:hypothetical protein
VAIRRRDFIKGIAGFNGDLAGCMVNIDMPHHPAIIEGRNIVEGRDPRHESRKAVQS